MTQDKNAANPLVSIVIPTYNRVDMLKEAIESVVKQNYRPLELVIVDDGSTDSTRETLIGMRQVLSEDDIELKIVISSVNLGCGPSLDIGFRLAKGFFVSYMGSDDLLTDPDKTNRQMCVMIHHDADWSYFTDMQMGTDPSKPRLFRPTYVPRVRCLNSFIARRPRLRLLFLLWRNPINSSSLMIRRETYNAVGGWEPWTKNADCDGLLLMRYSFLRLKCIDIDGAPVFYRVHKDQVSLDSTAMVKGKNATREYILQMLKAEKVFIGYRALARFFRWLG